MTPNDRERVLELFSTAVELPSAEQFAFLQNEVAEESTLFEEVMSLLKLDRQADADGFLHASALQLEAEHLAQNAITDRVGESIGPFRIVKLIGTGGMGSIYLAERDDEHYRRRVAIKIIKRGMDTDYVLRRFANERQILANLNHPNIARLYTGGATADGVPYFVMEFIEGAPLTEYANREGLSLNQRLKLFRKVCAAVQYAHQNLIVHRDLKPTNILVTSEGEPKLLDFGIAKLLNTSAAPEATATMLRAMTPEYASPEQIKGEPITTATDVYSLAVVLYELLTGSRPYGSKRDTPNEIAKAICEQEPPRPSVRVPTSVGSLSPEQNPAKADTLTPVNSNLLRGDLDNIVLMALRKEPHRRYSSVAEFSEDLERYLERRPVRARQDTAWYRTAKFVGRHRLGVAAGLVVLITLVSGVVATAWEAHVARVERARAERRFQDVRKLADSFMFEFHDAIKDLPGALNARQLVVKRAVEYLDGLAKEAGGDLVLQSELAQAYDKVGSITFDVRQTIDSHRKAMLLNEALVKADPQNIEYRKQLSDSYNYMSDVMKIAGHSSAAIDFARKSLAIFAGLAVERPGDKDIKASLADRNLAVGIALANAGDFQSALESDRAAMTIQQQLVSNDPNNQELRANLSVMENHLSSLLAEQGDFAGALEYHSKSFAITRSSYLADSTSARSRRSMWAAYLSLARLQLKTGAPRAAVKSCGEALHFLEQLSSADPKDTGHRVGMAVTYQIYGDALAADGRARDAESNYRGAISIGEALVADDEQRVEARNNLARAFAGMARLLKRAQRTAEADEYCDKARSLYQRSLLDDPQNARLRRESDQLTEMARPNREIH